MKTKQIALEPYLSVLHNWKILSGVISFEKLENILKREIPKYYQGEISYYTDYSIQEGLEFLSNKKDEISKYIELFKKSLDQIDKIIFEKNSKIKNIQLYKEITSYVHKDFLLYYHFIKDGIPFRNIGRENFYDIPYYIDNLRETHLHSGLAFDAFDIIETAIKNFQLFQRTLKNVESPKSKEIIERFILFIKLYELLELNKEKKDNNLSSLISILKKFDKKIPLSQNPRYFQIYTKNFDLKEFLQKVLKILKENEHNLSDKLAAVAIILNLNELLKVNTHKSLYLGLKHFSQEYIKNNPIKIAANKLVEQNDFFELYKKFFSKEKKVKAYELRMFPDKNSLKFWHYAIILLSSKENIIANKEILLFNKKKLFEKFSNRVYESIDKEFSLIFHYGKIKSFDEFENINRFYKTLYSKSKEFADFLKKYPEFNAFFAGIDAASMEYWTPAWAFAPLYSFWRNFYIHYVPAATYKNNSIKFTYHAGEDFVDLGTGLKSIYEALKFLDLHSGDRIGHGLALGINVKNYSLRHRKVKMPSLYYFFHLLWLNYMTYKHPELSGYKNIILREISRIINEYNFLKEFMVKLNKIKFKKEKEEQLPDNFYILLINLYESLKFDFINKGSINLKDSSVVSNSLFNKFWHYPLIETCRNDSNRFPCRVINILQILFTEYKKEKQIIKSIKKEKDYNVILDPLISEKSDFNFEEQIIFLEKIQEIIIDEVISKGIVIEACPSSNMYIRGLTDYKKHLVASDLREKIAKKELRVTLNTDDPLVFNNSLLDEFMLIYEALPENDREQVIRALIENSHNFAFKV